MCNCGRKKKTNNNNKNAYHLFSIQQSYPNIINLSKCVLRRRRRRMSSGRSCETETVAWPMGWLAHRCVSKNTKRTFGHVPSPRAHQSNYNYYYYFYYCRYPRICFGLISRVPLPLAENRVVYVYVPTECR